MPQAPHGRVRLGAFELDLQSGELRPIGAGEANGKVLLREQSFRVLRMLVERAGKIVTREEIKQRLWPNDTVVDFDHSINTVIKTLRRALGDSAEAPQYIETLARRGYRLRVATEWLLTVVENVAQPSSMSAASAASGSLIGTKVSHYRVLGVIGGGGMGMVYRAEDLKLGRPVALKFLPEDLVSDAIALKRFEREAQTASALNHPNICTIYEIEEHEGQPFIAMELLEGDTLRGRLAEAEAKGIPTNEILEIAVQICAGLEVAHEKGIVHRDIKPANIFLTKQGRVKILDFGLAKVADGPENTDPASSKKEMALGAKEHPDAAVETADLGLTRTGMTAGTAGYMSPEQIRREKLDGRSDLFSLGMVLYEMATGKRPFEGETAAAIQNAIMHGTPQPLRQVSPIASFLDPVIAKVLEKDRERRYQSAGEIRAELERARREMQPSRHYLMTRRWKIALPVVIVLMVVLFVGGLYWRFTRVPAITEKDTIVLADFANTTGDLVFDGALRQGLSVQLEQSPFLSLVSDEGIHETLRMMGQPANARLTREIAREVCQRTGSAVSLDGSIALVGTQYNLILKAVNCKSGDLVASTETRAKDKSHVLDALSNLASGMRKKLGESLSTTQKYDTALFQATTPSLEALQAWNLGVNSVTEASALHFYQRATQLDPNFALAYSGMSAAYFDRGEIALSRENAKKSFDLRARVSERERLLIELNYYYSVTGELTKLRQICEVGAQTYPRYSFFHNNLGTISNALGLYEAGLKEHLEAVRVEPYGNNFYRNVAFTYLLLNRVENAADTTREAHAKGLDSNLADVRYAIAFYRDDHAEMARQVAAATDKQGQEDLLLALDADTAAYFGRLGLAREFSRRAEESAEQAGGREPAATYHAVSALREALFGNTDKARREAALSKGRSIRRDTEYGIALALAYAEQADGARGVAEDFNRTFPEDTIVQFNYLPSLRAKLALLSSNPQEALDALHVAAPYELGLPAYNLYNWPNLYPVYVRGEAYLAAHRGREAAAEFQKIIDHRSIVLNEPIGALAYLQLGRAYVVQGDDTKAKASYQHFLALWKDADPDIPIYRQAKLEYAKLRAGSPAK